MALTRISGALVRTDTVTNDNIADGSIISSNFSEEAGGPAPASAVPISIAYLSGNATSAGETVTLTGSEFVVGTTIMISNTVASVVTVSNTTTLSFTSPDLPSGTYIGYIINPDSSMRIIPGLNYA